jgi:hypothetical protein
VNVDKTDDMTAAGSGGWRKKEERRNDQRLSRDHYK